MPGERSRVLKSLESQDGNTDGIKSTSKTLSLLYMVPTVFLIYAYTMVGDSFVSTLSSWWQRFGCLGIDGWMDG